MTNTAGGGIIGVEMSAPMPGTISEILVSVVDEVKFDDETHRSWGDEDE